MRDSKTRKIQILTDEQCLEVIRKKFDRDSMYNYKLVSYEMVPLLAVNGFMGQYFNLRASVKNQDTQDSRVVRLFIKVPPAAGSPQDEFNQEMGNCSKEFNLYNSVFPKIMVENHSNDFCVPECYLSLKDTAIVLDDMKDRGFKMKSKYEVFDYEHCVVVMKTLGKFHAKSMIFEEKEKKFMNDEFSYCTHETLWPLDKVRSMKMLTAARKGVVSMVDLLPELTVDEKRKLKNKITEMSIEHPKNLLPSKKFRNVLCHGDLWANNMLFSYDGDGNPVDCCLIDFQLARYNPPGHDILTFLQFCTTSELRKKRLDDMLRVYHESLTHSLRKSPGLYFSREDLDDSVKYLRIVCMLHGILNVPMQLIDEKAINKYFVEGESVNEDFHLDRSPLFCEQFNQVSSYKYRIIDSLLEFYEYILDFS